MSINNKSSLIDFHLKASLNFFFLHFSLSSMKAWKEKLSKIN